MKKLLGIILASIALVGCSTKPLVYCDERVDAVVINKEYKKPYITPIMSGKVVVPITHPEKYIVILQYDNVKESIDSESLYELVEIGSTLPVVYRVGKDVNGDVISESLKLLGLE